MDVALSGPVCHCPGRSLEVIRIESASTIAIPPQPQPIVHVDWCTSCGRAVRARGPELATDPYGVTMHRMGPRVMATAHVLQVGLGVPVRKVPEISSGS